MGICPNVTDKISRDTNLLASLSTLNLNFSALQSVVCNVYKVYPIGTIVFSPNNAYIPAGWMVCDGKYVDGTIYSTLSSLISGVYGPISGTFFKIPDCRARNFIQAGAGAGLTTRTFASSGGVEGVALTIAQMGSHTHTVTGDHIHFATSTHSHSVHDPFHMHDVDDPGHTHPVYYGIDPTTTQAEFTSAGYATGLATTSNAPSALTPSVGQINYGAANALSATSVYQDQHVIGAYNLGGTDYSTVPNMFWLQNYNSGGPQLMFGSTPESYWITPVNSKTTATPLQVTVHTTIDLDATVTPHILGIPYTSTDSFSATLISHSTGVTITSAVGTGQEHDNMAPYLSVVPIIRAV